MLMRIDDCKENWVFDIDCTAICANVEKPDLYSTHQFLNRLLLNLYECYKTEIDNVYICTFRSIWNMENFFDKLRSQYLYLDGEEFISGGIQRLENLLTHKVVENLEKVLGKSLCVSVSDDVEHKKLGEGYKLLAKFEKNGFDEKIQLQAPSPTSNVDKNQQLLLIAKDMAAKSDGPHVLRFFEDARDVIESALRFVSDPRSGWPRNVEFIPYWVTMYESMWDDEDLDCKEPCITPLSLDEKYKFLLEYGTSITLKHTELELERAFKRIYPVRLAESQFGLWRAPQFPEVKEELQGPLYNNTFSRFSGRSI